jgi:hypothetical protein
MSIRSRATRKACALQEVTFSYDWSAGPQSIREHLQFPPFGPGHLTNSLHHLAELSAPTSRAWTPQS